MQGPSVAFALQAWLCQWTGTLSDVYRENVSKFLKILELNSLLRNNSAPAKEEVKEVLDGNICRCTGYRPIFDAFLSFSGDEDPVVDIEELITEEKRLKCLESPAHCSSSCKVEKVWNWTEAPWTQTSTGIFRFHPERHLSCGTNAVCRHGWRTVDKARNIGWPPGFAGWYWEGQNLSTCGRKHWERLVVTGIAVAPWKSIWIYFHYRRVPKRRPIWSVHWHYWNKWTTWTHPGGPVLTDWRKCHLDFLDDNTEGGSFCWSCGICLLFSPGRSPSKGGQYKCKECWHHCRESNAETCSQWLWIWRLQLAGMCWCTDQHHELFKRAIPTQSKGLLRCGHDQEDNLFHFVSHDWCKLQVLVWSEKEYLPLNLLEKACNFIFLGHSRLLQGIRTPKHT